MEKKKGGINKNMPDFPGSIMLKAAPVLRGALAEPSGSEDDLYKRVILNLHTERVVREYTETEQAGSHTTCPVNLKNSHLTPLQLPQFSSGDSDESIRDKTLQAVNDYREKNGFNPRAAFVPGAGIIEVEDYDCRNNKPEAAGANFVRPLLKNKVALVTGSAGAIGSGICEMLLNNGCMVAAGDLPGARLDGIVKELDAVAPGNITGVNMDVTDADSVKEAFNRIILKWGGVDIVVINAGIAMVAGLKEMDIKAFQHQEKVNIEGTLLTLAEAGRCLSFQGTGGDIVLISTKNVFSPGAQFGAYSATKAAAHQLCRIASQEYAEDNIRVNMVSPDAVFSHGERKSGLWEKVGPDRMRRRGLDEKGLEEYYRGRNLLKARITADHVANAVLFFVSRRTPTTGATIPVDGGLPDATPR